MTNPELPRVSAPLLPEAWELPGRPEGGPATIHDTYRQTGFTLGPDLRLLHEGMNLQLALVRDAQGARYRTHPLAAALLLWTRGFLAIGDAAVLIMRGSYSSAPALVRSACEYLAASAQLRAEEQPAFLDWLAETLQPDEEHKAIDIGMGQFFAGSTIAADPLFANVYRAASELARPHLGAALALTASESSRARLAVTFGDQAFHAGWAQLQLGWLLALCDVQLRLTLEGGADVFPATPQRIGEWHDWQGRARAALAQPARCRMEPVDTSAGRRWLLSNYRRQPAGAPKKLLL